MPTPITIPYAAQSPFSPLPCPPSKFIRMSADFTLADSYEVSFSEVIAQNKIDSLQSMYVDNQGNALPITFLFKGSEQRIVFPANSQGYLPIVVSEDPTLNVTCVGGPAINFWLYNFPMPAYIWAAP